MKILLFILCAVIFIGCSGLNNGANNITSNDIKALEENCNNGNAESCNSLGVLYAKGEGVKQDYKKSVELFTKACNMNIALACFNLGVSYYNGFGVRQDSRYAKELFGKACDLGDQLGCDKYKRLNKSGF